MGIFHIGEGVKDNCWNLLDSFGKICVHCGCCSKDKETRYKGRIECLEAWIEGKKHFQYWSDDPETRKIQERNRAETLRHFKRKLRYYRKKLQEVTT